MTSAALTVDPGVARSGRSLTHHWVRSLASSWAPRARLAMAADSCSGRLSACDAFPEAATAGGRVAGG